MNCYQIMCIRQDVKWFSAIGHLSNILPIMDEYKFPVSIFLILCHGVCAPEVGLLGHSEHTNTT